MSVIDLPLRFPQCRDVLTHDEILAELRNQVAEKKFTQKALADRLGIAPPRVKEMLNGDRRIQQEEMPIVARWLGMSDVAAPYIPEGAIPVMPIPLLGEVPAGPWKEAIRTAHDFIPAPQRGIPAAAYALTVSGNSMDKIVSDGATIIIDPTDFDLFDKWLYVVRNGDGETTFKRYRDNPARLEPCSTDDHHQPIPVADRDYVLLGRVIKIMLDPDQAAWD